MIVSIHQPNFLPWLGYFYKIFLSDKYIFLDDVNFSKNSYINRSKIKTSQGEMWITVPVNASKNVAIKETKISSTNFATKLEKTLVANYKNTKYFDLYFNDIALALRGSYCTIDQLNINLIKHIARLLNIDTQFFLSSSYSSNNTGDDRLIDLIQKSGARTYLSGTGGSKYQCGDKFKQNGIVLLYHNFSAVSYEQKWGEFVPGLSVIDCLFNCGSSYIVELFNTLRNNHECPSIYL